jgi:hypothetical protein
MLNDREYIDAGGERCPNCEGCTVSTQTFDDSGDIVCRDCTCMDCYATWTEEFKLSGYDHLDIYDNTELEPIEGDYTITPTGVLGGLSGVGRVEGGSKDWLGTFDCDEDALEAIRDNCAKEEFWPNIWIVSDHGNWALYTGGKD